MWGAGLLRSRTEQGHLMGGAASGFIFPIPQVSTPASQSERHPSLASMALGWN